MLIGKVKTKGICKCGGKIFLATYDDEPGVFVLCGKCLSKEPITEEQAKEIVIERIKK